MNTASVTLAHSQIQALPSSPVELIAAPGANKIILPVMATAYFHWSANYGNIAATAALTLAANNGYNLLTALFNSFAGGVENLLNDDEDYFVVFNPLSDIAPNIGNVVAMWWYAPNFVNQNLTIEAYNASAGNFTDGDSANTLTVSVLYVVLDTTTGAFE